MVNGDHRIVLYTSESFQFLLYYCNGINIVCLNILEKDVRGGEELLLSYGDEYWNSKVKGG